MTATLSERVAGVRTTAQLKRRDLFGLIAVALFGGWAGTQVAVTHPGLVPGNPLFTVTGLWIALFGLVALVVFTQSPDYVRLSGPLVVWGVLNTAAFTFTVLALFGNLPDSWFVYAFWHVWVFIAAIGFAATGVLLERSGASGQHYFTAAGLEVSLLFIGLALYSEIVPGSYLLLAFVHPTPLFLDALSSDIDPARAAGIQLGLYALGLGIVLLV